MNIFDSTPLFDEKIGQPEPFLTPYLIEGEDNPCIIVLPGGGYHMLAEHEGEPYARRFNEAGLSAFVLTYRLAPYSYPCQLYDVQRAIKFVKANAARFHINPERVLVCGSSAGGHLAACACRYIDEGREDGDEVERCSSRPAGGVLCYPVVSLKELGHEGTTNAVTRGEPELIERLSMESVVVPDMPPLFIWHTFEDSAVDVRNSLSLAAAYKQCGNSCELHVFPFGWHGLGLAEDNAHVHQWAQLCENWLILNGLSNKSEVK